MTIGMPTAGKGADGRGAGSLQYTDSDANTGGTDAGPAAEAAVQRCPGYSPRRFQERS